MSGGKEGRGGRDRPHRDTLMSFSRDVPGAETIDKRRELEVRESYELGEQGVVWQQRRKSRKRWDNERERERRRKRKGERDGKREGR